ncbi:hypothetical protein [Magnetofaba australis]|uniref:Uncharacterized protein n=1 Tax=Magnetofaba australis IT-1 TaxID=1434232 RepID=A0A1Y2K147_9PROT|nr:hypothetical protein [Magnetofaba australis]OSM01692.1 hypothetical protein MAIT1_01712 [Magnetofaba australis IT-1]
MRMFWRSGALTALLLLAAPAPAAAFCVFNQTAENIHVQALDASRYQADIAPGGKACCAASQCRNDPTPLMAMSGYTPVKPGGQPGWDGECRVKTPRNGSAMVSGGGRALRCSLK